MHFIVTLSRCGTPVQLIPYRRFVNVADIGGYYMLGAKMYPVNLRLVSQILHDCRYHARARLTFSAEGGVQFANDNSAQTVSAAAYLQRIFELDVIYTGTR